MTIPRRVTVRGLMVLVAVVAVAVWGGMMMRRSGNFLRRADNHRFLAAIFQGRVEDSPATAADTSRVIEKRGRELRSLNHHSELARKYERAARYPWLPVAPDPPEPK